MILTVTFNPAIDKTAEVDELIPGGLNRLRNVMQNAGGKGINVSKTIHALQGKSVATGFLAGSAGEYIRKVLNGLAIDNDFVWVEGMTRTNLKVLDHEMELTELNEAGPVITETEIKQLKDKILSLLHPNDFVVLSGNVSAQVRKDIYRELIELVKQQGARVILDADGELFAQGIQAKPYVIKPNKYELATYFGVSQDCSNEEMISLAKTLLNEECRLVVVSMGKQGSIFLSHEGIYQAEALHIQAHSSVGAGDAMVAAIAYALEHDNAMEQLIALAVACSAGAVMTKGTQPAEKAVVEQLMKQVTIKKLEEN
ncbi:1-phosphofructokinase [[Clostridium] innocuum]|uniref:1-phosphofructokinase n=1 Tax=Clostridium innocuum TaxID=1522 RepID=UPI000D6CF13F|nr:1-phosphofructokinase [[Clostridium] innocuum]PWJ15908.1 fructose-1-phosphate kinase [[Clostridium] innocuum]SSA44072.1 fructose-1-phosphate kinase [[Clostridium] innocuum]